MLKTTYPYILVENIVYTYPNGDKKVVEFKDPIEIREKGWVLHDDDLEVKTKTTESDVERNLIRSNKRAKRLIDDYIHSNDFKYFVTLTYDPKKKYDFDIKNIIECMEDMQRFCKRQKRLDQDFKFLLIPELHKSGIVHWHGVLSFEILPITNAGSHKIKGGINTQVYYFDNWKCGFSNMTKILSLTRTSTYVSKYITKNMEVSLSHQRRYICSKGLALPKVTYNIKSYLDGFKSYENGICKITYINN